MRPVLYLPRTRNKSGSALRSAARWLAACAAVLWLAWVAWNPASGGSLGRLAHGLLHGFLGHAAILVPLLLLYGLTVLYFRLPGPRGYLAPALGGLLTLAGTSAGLSALQELSGAAGGWGGRLGGSLAA